MATKHQEIFNLVKEKTLFGRYIYNDHVLPLLDNLKSVFRVTEIGRSVLNKPIYAIELGNGPKRILMWSQMHGNESTTTKAVFDLLNLLSQSNMDSDAILNSCSIAIIPILNPDGAEQYTRVNANKVDLNRDAVNLNQPESVVLRDYYNKYQPHFCFNLHGQRTIFGVGDTGKSATVSFLSPAADPERTVNTTRKVAMELISAMNDELQRVIPGQVGIYDDSFNINCVGDTFQNLGTPTVLFEAGHYDDDYNREETRYFIFLSLLRALSYISENEVQGDRSEGYFSIPNNEKNFFDIIIRNVMEGPEFDIGIQYQEKLDQNTIKFIPKVEKISNLSKFFAHKVFNANKHKVLSAKGTLISEGIEIDFVEINSKKFSL
ncbi:M14 family metallopeptidase [Mangrovimonas sp. AS39]|uniref:M14 family metallopeptidase n=1 Tax=Mangrovimonas futianensis TaxID=2895523 RepID=UPI001E4DC60B|nr:M14 metallopeptidase family protein [Mangrovimonas futianensis]MCF1191669.1 M14 family metallopeptidase [Mangrovimonas futianensis]MCF1195443.1 M14 family metallopeptidase [Mangrovimonas futianensis]